MNIKSLIKKEFEFFGVFRASIPLNFFVMQAGVFLFFTYWLLSKDFSVYGDFPIGFGMHRKIEFDQYFPPLFYYLSGQFIYSFVPLLSVQQMVYLQLAAALFSFLGFVGIFPKLNAAFVFIIIYHFTGKDLLLNGSLDAFSTLPLCFILVLALSPSQNFYRFGKRISIRESSPDFHWPIFLLFFMISVYYTTGGLNKVVESSIAWPFKVHVDVLAKSRSDLILFLSSVYANGFVLSLFRYEWISILTSLITLFAETFFFTILFFPRFRFFFLFSMILMHIFIYYTHGYNYTGNCFFLLLCFDYNRIYNYFKKVEAAPIEK